MEVGRVGQGGPINIDIVSNRVDRILKTQNTESANNSDNYAKTDDKAIDIKEDDVKKAVDKLNMFLEDNNTIAEYEFHKKFSNDLMIKIVDKNTKEVIKEFPPEKILDMVAKMCEMVGVLFDKKA